MSLPPLSPVGGTGNPAPTPTPLRSCLVCGTPTSEAMCARCAASRRPASVAEEERRERVLQAARRDDEDRKAKHVLSAIGGVVTVAVVVAVALRLTDKPPRTEPVVAVATPVAVATAPPTPEPPRSYFVSVQPPRRTQPNEYVPRRRLTPEQESDLAASKARALRASQEAQDYRINDEYQVGTSIARATANTRVMGRNMGIPPDIDATTSALAAVSEARDNIRSLAPSGLPERQGQYREMVNTLDKYAADLNSQRLSDVSPLIGGGGGTDNPWSNVRLN